MFYRASRRAVVGLAFALACWPVYAHEVPLVEVHVGPSKRVPIPPCTTPLARQEISKLDDKTLAHFLRKREKFLNQAALAVHLTRYPMALALGLGKTLSLIFGGPPGPPPSTEALLFYFLLGLDRLLCENPRLTASADRFGLGLAFGGAVGAGVDQRAWGHGLHLFGALELSITRLPRLRAGIELEHLVRAFPYLGSVGVGFRPYFYFVHGHAHHEDGEVIYPFIGPFVIRTSDSLTIGKSFGVFFSVPGNLRIDTHFKRRSFSVPPLHRSCSRFLRWMAGPRTK